MSSKNIKEQVLYLIDQWMSHRKIAKALGIWVASVSRIRNLKKEDKLIITPTVEWENRFHAAIKEHQEFEKSFAGADILQFDDPRLHKWRGKEYPFAIVDDYCHIEPAVAKSKKKMPWMESWERAEARAIEKEAFPNLQPYKLLVSKDNEVDVVDEELSALDKILERLAKKGITIWGIDYQALRQHKCRALEPYLDGDESNVLVIGDIHAPHDLDGYLAFCREQQELWNCGTIIFIGDVADFHSISQRQKIPEILNPKWEIALAIERLKDWYATFPKATVTLGNHDLRPWKAAAGAWLLREFIQDANTIFQAPATYDFVNEIIINNVLYTHWTKGTAFKKCVTEWMNIVQWHCHNSAGVQFYRNRQWQVRWMQTGNWIDYEKVAFDYARELSAQPVLSCGVVLNNWRLPIVLPFK